MWYVCGFDRHVGRSLKAAQGRSQHHRACNRQDCVHVAKATRRALRFPPSSWRHNKVHMMELVANLNRGVADPDFTVEAVEGAQGAAHALTAPRNTQLHAPSAAPIKNTKTVRWYQCHSHFTNPQYCTPDPRYADSRRPRPTRATR
jgi:hypothetical protein